MGAGEKEQRRDWEQEREMEMETRRDRPEKERDRDRKKSERHMRQAAGKTDRHPRQKHSHRGPLIEDPLFPYL